MNFLSQHLTEMVVVVITNFRRVFRILKIRYLRRGVEEIQIEIDWGGAS